jgi:hypothetical protein
MYKHILLSGLLAAFSIVVMCQNKRIDIQVVNCSYTNTDISFNLIVTNVSDTFIRTYLPQKEDICHHLLKIKFVNMQTGQVHNLFPCTKITDLDCIVLDTVNTLTLNSMESFKQKFKFPRSQIIPRLKKKGHYQLYVEWHLTDIYFESPFQDVFKEEIKSNKIDIPSDFPSEAYRAIQNQQKGSKNQKYIPPANPNRCRIREGQDNILIVKGNGLTVEQQRQVDEENRQRYEHNQNQFGGPN